MARVFTFILGSNSAQISISGVRYLRDHPSQGWLTPTTRGAPFLAILPPNFVFGALFGPDEVLETHLAPFLNQITVLEQKN